MVTNIFDISKIHDEINTYIDTNICSNDFEYKFLQARLTNNNKINDYQIKDLKDKIENQKNNFTDILNYALTKDVKYLYNLNSLVQLITILVLEEKYNDTKNSKVIILENKENLNKKTFFLKGIEDPNQVEILIKNLKQLNKDTIKLIDKKISKKEEILKAFFNLLLAEVEGSNLKIINRNKKLNNLLYKEEAYHPLYNTIITLLYNQKASNTALQKFYNKNVNLIEIKNIDIAKKFIDIFSIYSLSSQMYPITNEKFHIIYKYLEENKKLNNNEREGLIASALIQIPKNEEVRKIKKEIDNLLNNEKFIPLTKQEKVKLLVKYLDERILEKIVKEDWEYINNILKKEIDNINEIDNIENLLKSKRYVGDKVNQKSFMMIYTEYLPKNKKIEEYIKIYIAQSIKRYNHNEDTKKLIENIINTSKEEDLQQIYLDIFEYFIKLNPEIRYRNDIFGYYIRAMGPLIKKIYTNSERIAFCKENKNFINVLLSEEDKTKLNNDLEKEKELKNKKELEIEIKEYLEYLETKPNPYTVANRLIHYSKLKYEKACLNETLIYLANHMKDIKDLTRHLNSIDYILTEEDIIKTLKIYLERKEKHC